MALETCEQYLMTEIRYALIESTKLYFDNQATMHIASDPGFHERIKHIVTSLERK